MNNSDYEFVSLDAEALQAQLIAAYERICGLTVQPASPERLFIQWVASIILQERMLLNYAGNQNIPSRAEGENLDALAELFYLQKRPQAEAAACTERFYISEPQEQAILIPAGTRVTDSGCALVWETTADVYIFPGESWADAALRCQTAGVIGNGWAAGQINQAVDLYNYYSGCENITASDGGRDRATDEEFYALLRASQDAYSTAGAKGAYIYHAKKVSGEIADVVANSPSPGVVKLYVLTQGGQPAGEELKAAVLAACSPDEVRAFTDLVTVEDPETVSYDIDIAYYLSDESRLNAAATREAAEAAVQEYAAWQCGRLGRDINPSYLHSLLMQTGVKRVEIAAPAFTRLNDGGNTANPVPQVAALGSVNIQSGGYEDE